MGGLKYRLIRAAFDALSLPGVTGLLRRASRCRGVIFTLHRVLPEPPAAFSPNAILQVTPDFLDYAITRVRALGLDIVDLDEALRRLGEATPGRPFAVFTFDDGYRDNRVHALPILQRHRCPFTLYLPTALVDGEGEIWWQALEDIIAREPVVTLTAGGIDEHFDTATVEAKQAAFDIIYWRMRKMPESERVKLIRTFAAFHGMDLARHCRSLIMDWREIAEFAADPLCTIGAHTVRHYELAKLPEEEASLEMARSRDIIAEQLGKRPEHLSFPLGGPLSAGPREFAAARALGFRSAVTTRPGGLYADADLHALPRVSLNGLFQARRYVDVFATGAVFSTLGRLGG